jgi:hypothetical protein
MDSLLGGRAIGLVVQQQPCADVCHLPGQLGCGQAHVKRNEHGAHAAGPVDELDGRYAAAQQQGHAVACSHAQAGQPSRHAARAAIQLTEGQLLAAGCEG